MSIESITTTRTLAIHGGEPIRPHPIEPNTYLSRESRARVDQLLDSGVLSAWYGGRFAREFESRFASYLGGGHAVGVNSGTSALHAAVVAAGIGPGDEVLMPAAAYVSAASVVVQEQAVPVLCDIDPETFTIDPGDLERRITPRSRAVIPVHFWGCPADMDAVTRIAAEHGLTVIEDCGQSHGATVGSRKTGLIGRFGCYSLAPRKHISTGEGGIVTCREEEDARRVREVVNKGKGLGWLDYHRLGYSYAMPEFEAVVALDGLARLDEEIKSRRQAAGIYRRELADTPLSVPGDPAWGRHVYFKIPFTLPEVLAGERDFVVDALHAENVSCRPPHPPMYTIPWLAEYAAAQGRPYDRASFPVTERLLHRMFEVESGPCLPPHEAELSARAVREVWQHIAAKAGS